MITKPSMSEIAVNRELWEQYVDPQNGDPKAFDRMSIEGKINLQRNLWPDEYAQEMRDMAEAVAWIVEDGENDVELDELKGEICDWLIDGETVTNQTADDLAAKWQEYCETAAEATEDYE